MSSFGRIDHGLGNLVVFPRPISRMLAIHFPRLLSPAGDDRLFFLGWRRFFIIPYSMALLLGLCRGHCCESNGSVRSRIIAAAVPLRLAAVMLVSLVLGGILPAGFVSKLYLFMATADRVYFGWHLGIGMSMVSATIMIEPRPCIWALRKCLFYPCIRQHPAGINLPGFGHRFGLSEPANVALDVALFHIKDSQSWKETGSLGEDER